MSLHGSFIYKACLCKCPHKHTQKTSSLFGIITFLWDEEMDSEVTWPRLYRQFSDHQDEGPNFPTSTQVCHWRAMKASKHQQHPEYILTASEGARCFQQMASISPPFIQKGNKRFTGWGRRNTIVLVCRWHTHICIKSKRISLEEKERHSWN